MPVLRLETNISASKIPTNFLSDTTAMMAKILGKSQDYCMVTIVPDVLMAWASDSDSPCATGSLMSIGQFGVDENKKYAAALYDYIEKSLGIPKDKMYICFTDMKSYEVGYGGSTLHDVLG